MLGPVTVNAGQIIFACALLVLGVIVLAVGVWYYRRRWMDSADSSATPWTFEDLRKLRDQGALSEEEYQALRAAIIGAYRGSSAGPDAAGKASDSGGSNEGWPV